MVVKRTLRRPLVGREPELATVRALVDSASQGALLLSGEPGVGKTTLWEAGIEAARERGTRVLHARAAEAETKLSFAALSDLLQPVGVKTLGRLPAPQRHAVDVALLRADPAGDALEPRTIAGVDPASRGQ